MILSHTNLNELKDVVIDPKSIKENEDPDYESAKIKSAVLNGVKLNKEQIKEVNTHFPHIILEAVFNHQMYA